MSDHPARGSSARSRGATLQLLMKAANKIFSDKNYLDVKVADIVQEAGVAHGTFYVYFKNKEDCFEKVISALIDEMWKTTVAGPEQHSNYQTIEAVNRVFLEVFQNQAGLIRNLFQVVTFNERVAKMQHEARHRFFSRIESDLRKKIEQGTCYPIEPAIASTAVGGMVEWFAYLWLAAQDTPQDQPFEMEKVVHTLSTLWYRALYQPVDPRQ
ncbi:MAG: TetR/AcrR family transcriptional regulator [Bacillota bacterium]